MYLTKTDNTQYYTKVKNADCFLDQDKHPTYLQMFLNK